MRASRNLVVLSLSVMLAAGVAGCGKKKEVEPTPPPVDEEAERRRADSLAALERARADSIAAAEAAAAAAAAAAAIPPLSLSDIYFDYDKATLTDMAKSALNDNAAGLTAHPKATVMIEGHCDERGTNEYNLALGERRAAAAKDYLVTYGVDAGRLSTVSYGEERPVDPGHDETAWSKNRRDHFAATE